MACIPDLRPELLAIAERLPYAPLKERMEMAERLRWIESEMHRRPAVTKVRVARSPPMNPVLAARIRNYHYDHPGRAFHEIAAKFRVNSARVSEAIAGKRR
jgi:hypothetical protein